MKLKLYQIKELIKEEEIENRMAGALRAGCLPDCFLYTAEGAERWLRLDASQEFPITRGLTELLRSKVDAITQFIPPNCRIVSMGIGNGEKEKALLQHLQPAGTARLYAVDISRPLVETAIETFREANLPIYGIVAFLEDINQLLPGITRPVVFCILGNSFCNYDPESFLDLVSRHLTYKDLFLFDCHLCTNQMDSVEKIYQSPMNVAFNLGPLLNRGMPADSFQFSLKMVPIASQRLGTIWKTRKLIRILRSGRLRVGDESVSLPEGKEIRMGFTYKFTRKQVESLLLSAGLMVIKQVISPARDEMILLTRKK